MKVLQIYTYYPPENVASTHLKKDLTDAYVAAGFELCVVAPIPTRGVDNDVYEEYKNVRKEVLYDGHVVVNRFPVFREGHRFVSRIFRYLLVNIRQYRKAVQMDGIDIISSGSTPPTQGLVCARVKKKLGVPFVYNLQDIFPDSLVNSGVVKKGSFIWEIGRLIENRTYRSADKIIVISEDYKQNIMQKGVPAEKIVVVSNWVNVDNVYPVDRSDNVLFDRFSLDRKHFYITYCGNIGMSQNLSHLLDAAERIEREIPDIRFVIIGEGVEKEKLISRIKERSITNTAVYPFQAYEDIAHVFSLGDAGLVISKRGVGLSSVPSKTWSIMAAQKPILVSLDENSDLVRMINEVSCGLTSEPDDIDSLVNNIKILYQDSQLCHDMGTRGRNYLQNSVSREACVAKYVETLQTVALEHRN